MLLVYLFFFKQKTAYEMRISDWSSDVCSSDLPARPQAEAVMMLGHEHDIARARIAKRFRPAIGVPLPQPLDERRLERLIGLAAKIICMKLGRRRARHLDRVGIPFRVRHHCDGAEIGREPV